MFHCYYSNVNNSKHLTLHKNNSEHLTLYKNNSEHLTLHKNNSEHLTLHKNNCKHRITIVLKLKKYNLGFHHLLSWSHLCFVFWENLVSWWMQLLTIIICPENPNSNAIIM